MIMDAYDNEEKEFDIRLLRDGAGNLTLQQAVRRWHSSRPASWWTDWIDVPVEETVETQLTGEEQ